MCEERVVRLLSILQSLATRVPRIILQRAEEMFPALRESLVSVLCMCAQKRIVLSSSVNSDSQRNKYFMTLKRGCTHCNSLVYCGGGVIDSIWIWVDHTVYMWKVKLHPKFWTENLKEKDYFEDLYADERILLRQIFIEIIWEVLDWVCLAQDTEPWLPCVNTLNMNITYHKKKIYILCCHSDYCDDYFLRKGPAS
jgi:hypothetical protein